jgi:hypothetical protein
MIGLIIFSYLAIGIVYCYFSFDESVTACKDETIFTDEFLESIIIVLCIFVWPVFLFSDIKEYIIKLIK